MSGPRYPEEFKIEAVKQVTDLGHSVADVADRLGVTSHRIYNWLKKYGPKAAELEANTEEAKKIKSLEKELKRVTEERDILKKSGGILRKPIRLRYTFIKDNMHLLPVRQLCRIFDVHPSGFYAWIKKPTSLRERRDVKLTSLIKQFWLVSGNVYSYRKLHSDLQDVGEKCGINRVHKLMRQKGIKAQVGYRKPRHRGGNQHVVVSHRLQREFNPLAPNTAWVNRYHLYQDTRGLALLSRCFRFILSKNRWLVDAIINDQTTCSGCAAYGCLAKKT